MVWFYYKGYVQMMQTEQQTVQTLIRLFLQEQSDLGTNCVQRYFCPNSME